MGRLSKLEQYDRFNQTENCFGRYQIHPKSINAWRDRSRPLALEIGAGRAEIAIFLATTQPEFQVIAIDKKSDRLFKGALSTSLNNIVFLQTDLDHLADQIALSDQVDLIWLPFPDPFPRRRQAKLRLSHPRRLQIYADLLKKTGRLRLKTDDAGLFAYSQRNLIDAGWAIIASDEDLSPDAAGAAAVTSYERRFRAENRPITFIEAAPPQAPGF